MTSGPSTENHGGFAYLAGIGVTHSIAPPMHNYIAKSLNCNWQFLAQECPKVQDAIDLFRQPSFAGAVITMPYKRTIMDHLDGLDDYAVKLGACNNVYRDANGSLRGTNTDWRGIQGCLLDASVEGKGKPSVIIGAGGASRAALYALHDRLDCNPIYVVNRNEEEISAFIREAKEGYSDALEVVHIQREEQVLGLPAPYYIVGTVPDAEPSTPKELEVQRILNAFLSIERERGVLLDMCFKPRRTRILKEGEGKGWKTVEGTEIIGHQIQEQYRLWCGEEQSKNLPVQEAWSVLRRAAEESPAINF